MVNGGWVTDGTFFWKLEKQRGYKYVKNYLIFFTGLCLVALQDVWAHLLEYSRKVKLEIIRYESTWSFF